MWRMMAAMAFVAAGCGAVAPAPGEQQSAVDSNNGQSFNGQSFNGQSFNGVGYGAMIDSVALSGFAGVSNVHLSGSTLVGTRNGATISGAQFEGVQLTALLRNVLRTSSTQQWVGGRGGTETTTTTLKIGYVATSTVDSEITLYSLMYPVQVETTVCDATAGVHPNVPNGGTCYTETDTEWRPVCGVDTLGRSNSAVAIAGRWDYAGTGGKIAGSTSSYVTFSCTDGAIAKCAERLHYKPWKTGTIHIEGFAGPIYQSVPLDDYHQACIRMLRDDYCGNGDSETVTGRLINVYDSLDNSRNVDTESWVQEADWGVNGATNLYNDRMVSWPTNDDVYLCDQSPIYYVYTHCPGRLDPSCGESCTHLCGPDGNCRTLTCPPFSPLTQTFLPRDAWNTPVTARALIRDELTYN